MDFPRRRNVAATRDGIVGVRKKDYKLSEMSGPIVSRAQTTHGDGDARTDASQLICAVCEKTDKLQRCSRCKAVFYCTREHQRRDWKRHREFCATHPARDLTEDEPLPGAAKTRNREIPSKQRHPVGKSRVITPNTLVSNLSNVPVSDASNVTLESLPLPLKYRNAKHFAGTFVFFCLSSLSAGTWNLEPALSGFPMVSHMLLRSNEQ